MILFGHQTGNPNAHNAALAHYEAGRLDAFVVPWFPSRASLSFLHRFPFMRAMAARLGRRRFEALGCAPLIQGRLGEFRRLAIRASGLSADDERLSYEVNDWVMHTMTSACHRPTVTAVHSYEDCSLEEFEEAKRLGKACIYDLPIGYYPAWEQLQAELVGKFADWLPAGGFSSNRWARPEQKRREMELADLVLAPSTFVKETILSFRSDKKIALAPYGVDLEFWKPPAVTPDLPSPTSQICFMYAGQVSVRKGVPVLLEAWRKADLHDATLMLIGSWRLAEARRLELPVGVTYSGPVSPNALRQALAGADVFVFPTFFEGRSLIVGEALASGLPVVTTEASGMTDLVDETCGRIVPAGNEEALVEALRWFAQNRERLPAMKSAARAKAETCTWAHYRQRVSEAVAPLV